MSARLQLDPSQHFAALYRQHHHGVWRMLWHLSVQEHAIDDAVQDVFLVVHARLPEFEGRSKIRTWIYAIARRVAANYRRRAQKESRHKTEGLPEASDDHCMESWMARMQVGAWLATFLEDLTPACRQIYVLASFEDYSTREIARELGINVNTVQSRLRAMHAQRDKGLRRWSRSLRVYSTPPTEELDQRRVANWSVLMAPLAPTTGAPLALAAQSTALAKAGPSGLLGMAHTASVKLGFMAAGAAMTLSAGMVMDSMSGLDEDTSQRVELPAKKDRHRSARRSTQGLAPDSAMAETSAALPTTPILEPRERTQPALAGQAPTDPVGQTEPIVPPPPAIRPPLVSPQDHDEPPKNADDSLKVQLRQLQRLRTVGLHGDHHTGLALAQQYLESFPQGVFIQEVEGLGLQMRCRLELQSGATRPSPATVQSATAYLERWPSSIMSERIAGDCRL